MKKFAGGKEIEEKIKVILCEVGKDPEVKIVPNEPDWMEEFVGGYLEAISITRDGLILICNDEGMRLGLPVNHNFGLGVLGNFIICRTEGVELASVTQDDLKMLNLL